MPDLQDLTDAEMREIIKKCDYEWEYSGDHGKRKEYRVSLLDYDGDCPQRYYFRTLRRAQKFYNNADEYQVFLQKRINNQDKYETLKVKIPSIDKFLSDYEKYQTEISTANKKKIKEITKNLKTYFKNYNKKINSNTRDIMEATHFSRVVSNKIAVVLFNFKSYLDSCGLSYIHLLKILNNTRTHYTDYQITGDCMQNPVDIKIYIALSGILADKNINIPDYTAFVYKDAVQVLFWR